MPRSPKSTMKQCHNEFMEVMAALDVKNVKKAVFKK
jgi:hypothetical protein